MYSYKWANLKNCTKLHCEFHKWIKIITFLCALKKITILFQLNGITDFVISSFKRTEPTSTHCTHEMCQWHKQPVPFDSLCRAYLIAVQCQFLLTLAEKYFNRPSTHIPGKNLLCRQGCVCTDESTQCFGITKCFFRITQKNYRIFYAVEVSLVPVHIIVSFFDCHKVKSVSYTHLTLPTKLEV